ncbi:NAD(P)-dependent oxidoreductase [Streptomyces parvus]|uniref:NAD(P)-dependent oxidoreductase n=1 Tax=Streptomyces parvus TaxID=66428 RepID=A0A7K3RWQ3_9ACTN|nr:NAD(P)-dependent oxidoreductase [Streptomyces parvus]
MEGQTKWLHLLRESDISRVIVVGGSGRLGSLLSHLLTRAGVEVGILDSAPCEALPGTTFTQCDLGRSDPISPDLFAGADAVVHLAALHGAHLLAGYPRRDFWKVNVRGTERVLTAARAAEVPRAIVASSTSVYGSGSSQGPAYVLNEDTAFQPEDVYDFTKLASEELLRKFGQQGGSGVALRFGRFFFPSHLDYHLRKLSTGLDALDACQAIVRAITSPASDPFSAYCIASDLPLEVEQRERLGHSVADVLEESFPQVVKAAEVRGYALPTRVGKSVDTSKARTLLGYAPERALDWAAGMWLEGAPPTRPRLPAQRWLDAAV